MTERKCMTFLASLLLPLKYFYIRSRYEWFHFSPAILCLELKYNFLYLSLEINELTSDSETLLTILHRYQVPSSLNKAPYICNK